MWQHILSVLVIVFCWTQLVATTTNDDVIVETKDGLVRGFRSKSSFSNRSYLTFSGIPYAKPPVGERRFKPPEKSDPWKGILKANKFAHSCFQGTIYASSGQEDCLYLNVFVPDLIRNGSMFPVLVFIHGGGFVLGSSWSKPELLLDEEIVIVTIAYRLGAFGFLSLNTPEYSGNMGLKDQVMALKWINENIHAFSGDRGKITIHGNSAGSISVGMHLLSHASRKLFQQIIFESGCHLNTWALTKQNATDLIVSLYAAEKSMAEEKVNLSDLIDWLKIVDRKRLLFHFEPHIPNGISFKKFTFFWAPVIEPDDAPDAFLNKPIEEYLKETNDITTLFGYTSAEAMFFLVDDLNKPELLKPFNDKFQIQLPLINLRHDFKSPEYIKAVKEVRQTYFGDRPVDKSTRNEYVQLMSDLIVAYGTYVAAKNQAKQSSGKTYFYKFSIETELNRIRKSANASTLGVRGATHTEIHQYLFDIDLSKLKPESKEWIATNYARSLFANFVKFGNPIPNGKPALLPIEGDDVNYVDITNDGYMVGVNPQSRVFRFWDKFFIKYKNLFQ